MSDKAKFFDDLQRKYELGVEQLAKNIKANVSAFIKGGPYTTEEVSQWLTGLGVQNISQEIVNSYDDVIQYATLVASATDIPLVLPETSATILSLYKENQVQHILKASDEIVKTVADASLRYGIGEQKIATIISDLEKTVETVGRRIVTEAFTGANIYDRTIKYMQFTNANIELYFYDGPLDSHTRDVCRDTLNDPRQATGWRLIDVQSSQTPFSTCGGYNCRHEWLPYVPGLDAEIERAAKAAGIPEVQVGEQ
jgi:hypothetical protein